MKKSKTALFIIMLALFTGSCDEPETVVTNVVHPDGSVTRIVEMKNSKNKFGFGSVQVPVDSTWTFTDSVSVGEKGDTTWYRRAEKHFRSAGEINMLYNADASYNKSMRRSSEFKKRFKWFNTEYIFSENVFRTLSNGYPLSKFMDSEQLDWYFAPGPMNEKLVTGPDSLKYRALQDSVKGREDFWLMSSLCSEFISEFGKLTRESKSDSSAAALLKVKESQLIRFLQDAEEKNVKEEFLADSILEVFVGRGASLRFKSEADSAINSVIAKALADFKEYAVRVEMPGRLLRSNGFAESGKVVSWPVRSEFFLTEDYRMEAVSVAPNLWAWIISGLFILFVGAGIANSKIKRARQRQTPFIQSN